MSQNTNSPKSSVSSPEPQLITETDIQLTFQVTAPPKDLFQILLDQKYQVHESSPKTTPQLSQSIHDSSQGCKCSKIGCLKMYCQCFSKGKLCSQKCVCLQCCNKMSCKLQIYKARKMANFRHPGTFKEIAAWVPTKRCTCKKSQCKKNYCDCFRAGVRCSQQCECLDCQNGRHSQGESFDQRIQIEVNA